MGAEGVGAEPIEVTGESADSRQNFHRRKIEVRPLPPPGLHNAVDLVAGLLAGHNRSLDVKSLDVEIYSLATSARPNLPALVLTEAHIGARHGRRQSNDSGAQQRRHGHCVMDSELVDQKSDEGWADQECGVTECDDHGEHSATADVPSHSVHL